MRYFLVLFSIIAVQFVSVRPEPVRGLLDGLVDGIVDLVVDVLDIVVSLLRSLLSGSESREVDAAADTTTKKFNEIIRKALKIDPAITRYDLDDAIDEVKKIAVKLVRIIASINDKTLARHRKDIKSSLNSGMASLNNAVRKVITIANVKVRPVLSASKKIALDKVIDSVVKAAGEVANSAQVAIFRTTLSDVYNKPLTEDVSNVVLKKDDVLQRYSSNLGSLWYTAPGAPNVNLNQDLMTIFFVSYNVLELIESSSERMLTTDNTYATIPDRFKATIASINGLVRTFITKAAAIRPSLSAEAKASFDKIIDSLVATSAAVINTIQTYYTYIQLFDIYKDNSVIPKKYKKEYHLVVANKNWNEALQTCKALGWELATVDSADENSALVNLITERKQLDKTFWLGANDLANHGTFVWESTNKPLTYTNWGPTDPNNPGSCLEINSAQTWWDQLCTEKQSYVCHQMVEI